MHAELFLKQFGHLANSDGGVKKLRQMVLQMAVRGKLIAQDAEDEPAELLLKKIEKARKNFTSDYNLNTLKENQPVNIAQVPHSLPTSWKWVRLSNIGVIVGGGTPSSSNLEYFCNDGIAWLTPADMYALKGKFISHGRRDLTSSGLSNSSAQLMPKGSVLFSSRAPIGYVAIAANEVTTNQGFKSCVPFIGDMSEYIYCYLKSAVAYVESLASGTTFKEVSGKVVANVLFPLPPLAEQKRIVAKVDELMAVCDALEAAQNTQRTLKTQAVQSTLHHLTNAESPASFGISLNILERTFGNWFDDLATVKHLRATILQLAVQGKLVPQNPTDQDANELLKQVASENSKLIKDGVNSKKKPLTELTDQEITYDAPDGWVWSRMGDIAHYQKGYAFKSEDYLERGLMITKIKNLTDNHTGNSVYITPERAAEFNQYLLRENDIVMTTVGSWFSSPFSAVGRSFVVNAIFDNSLLNQNAVRIRFLRGLVPMYFFMCINSPTFKSYLVKEAQGTANQASITQESIKNFLVCVPPLAEQKRIVAKVDELMTLCDQLEAQLTTTQTLNAALMDALLHHLCEGAENTLNNKEAV